MLERSATADLFKNTLSHIPTVFGRLAYLASLRDPVSGIYRHHGLGAIFGREESRKALYESHWNVFREWLNLPLQHKSEDLQAYLSGLEEPRALVLQHWANAQMHRSFMPTAVRKAEEELFVQEFDILLEVLNCAPKRQATNNI
ncbi:MAG: hypothetical protein JO062_14405 [Bryobacterales bacterium]|nr:hypothetical protein [Bryobacterales bacterium]